MVTRVGDHAQSYRMTQSIQTVQGRMRERQTEVSTQKVAQSYAEIARDAGILLRTKEDRDVATIFAAEGRKVDDRLNVVSGAIGNMSEIAERFRARLVQRLDATTGNKVPLAVEARTMLSEVAAQLNLKLDERYLFAGSQIDTAPVALPTPPPVAADPALYYRGDDVITTVRASSEVEIPYGVTAADPAFAALIGALGQAIGADEAGDVAGLRSALDRAEVANTGLAELRGATGATSARIQATVDQHLALSSYLGDVIGRIEDTDIAAAVSMLARDEVALQASYLASSRISSLTLADYIR